MNIDPETLNLAVIRFLGMETQSFPSKDSSRLVETFGAKLARELEIKVTALLDELHQLTPNWSVHTLPSAGTWAREEMHRKHPDLDSGALDALEWDFTYFWK